MDATGESRILPFRQRPRASRAYRPDPNGESGLNSVHDPGALADQALALPVRTPGVLLLERRHRGHAAVVVLAAQPAEEGALERVALEPVGLGPTVLAGDGHARGVDDVGLDAGVTHEIRASI